jgi:ATP-binding cassette subfamily C protein LapB
MGGCNGRDRWLEHQDKVDDHLGGLIAVTMLLGRCIAPMRQLAGLITRIHGAKAAFSSLEKLMEKPVEMDIHKSYLQKTQFEGAFEFNNVSFAYPEAEVQSLHEVSFKIKPGQKIGVLGRVGSGKSTIGKLLMRYYLPSEGSVYVDGTDIQQINPYDLRRHIGMCHNISNSFLAPSRIIL